MTDLSMSTQYDTVAPDIFISIQICKSGILGDKKMIDIIVLSNYDKNTLQ